MRAAKQGLASGEKVSVGGASPLGELSKREQEELDEVARELAARMEAALKNIDAEDLLDGEGPLPIEGIAEGLAVSKRLSRSKRKGMGRPSESQVWVKA